MSTVSGFIVGLGAAAVLAAVYSEQLEHVLAGPLAAEPVAPIELAARLRAVASPAEETPREPPPPSEPAQAETADGKAAATALEPVATGAMAGVAPEGDGESQPEAASSALERHWQAFATRADSLQAVGEYPWRACFRRAAASHDVPESLLLAIASGESNFDPAARSHKDAVGLMQIRWPDTSRDLGIRREADLYDPCTNVDAGARYLAQLIERFDEKLHLAVAAYNYGPGRIAPGRVPEGARWYSHYIYQHLQQVLGREHVATSELLPPRPDAPGGREVLMRFNRSYRARDFIAFLKAQNPELELQQKSEVLGRHEVVLLYGNESERQRALAAINRSGVSPLALQYNSNIPL